MALAWPADDKCGPGVAGWTSSGDLRAALRVAALRPGVAHLQHFAPWYGALPAPPSSTIAATRMGGCLTFQLKVSATAQLGPGAAHWEEAEPGLTQSKADDS